MLEDGDLAGVLWLMDAVNEIQGLFKQCQKCFQSIVLHKNGIGRKF